MPENIALKRQFAVLQDHLTLHRDDVFDDRVVGHHQSAAPMRDTRPMLVVGPKKCGVEFTDLGGILRAFRQEYVVFTANEELLGVYGALLAAGTDLQSRGRPSRISWIASKPCLPMAPRSSDVCLSQPIRRDPDPVRYRCSTGPTGCILEFLGIQYYSRHIE